MLRLFLLATSLLSQCPFKLYADELRVGLTHMGRPPLSFPEGAKESGIYVDVLNAIVKDSGDSLKFSYYPPKRLMQVFDNGEIDIEIGVNPQWRKSSKVPGLYTLAFAKADDVVLFHPGKKIPVKSPQDLYGKTVGVLRGYFYEGFMEAFDKKLIIRNDADGEENLLQRLAKGRFDQAIVRRDICLYWIKNTKEYQKLEVGDSLNVTEIMVRVHPQKEAAVARFNSAIQKLISSGEIDKIYQSYR